MIQPQNIARSYICTVVKLVSILAIEAASATADTLPSTVAEVAEQLAQSHHDLLHLEGGFEVSYHIDVEQDPSSGRFAFVNGLDGIFRVHWPELFVHVVGDLKYNSSKGPDLLKDQLREANYNFESHTSLAREGSYLAQACDFRHAFTSKHAYPIRFQYFSEANQFFLLDGENRSDTWLPEALNVAGYELRGEQPIYDMRCIVVERPGADKLWVSPDHDCAVVRRELYYNTDRLSEVTVNRDFVELSDNVWLPRSQTRESYSGPADSLNYTLTLTVNSVRVGNVSPTELVVNIPEDIKEVDDFIQGKFVRDRGTLADGGQHAIDSAKWTMKKDAERGRDQPKPVLIVWNIGLLLFLAICFVLQRSEKSK